MGRFSQFEKDLMSKLELRGGECIKQKKGRLKTSLFYKLKLYYSIITGILIEFPSVFKLKI